jgi:beta-phosphoglucomutase-like phosphatase (HAD superfamily)
MTRCGPADLPQAVVFDNDGLLLDTEQAWTRAEVTLFGRRGRAFTIEHKRYLLGSSRAVACHKLEEMLEQPAGTGTALMDELAGLVWEEVAVGVPAMPGAVALVDALRARGTPVGLASNSARSFVDRALAIAGLAAAFDTTVAGDEVAAPKPAPDIYLEAACRLGAAPERCVALEDSPTGVTAARAAGMFVIGVPSVKGVELAADLVVASLEDPAAAHALGL